MQCYVFCIKTSVLKSITGSPNLNYKTELNVYLIIKKEPALEVLNNKYETP